MTHAPAHRSPSRFRAIDISIQAIKSLRSQVALLKKRDRHLADQVQGALSSVPLNLAEGSGRADGNRRLSYRRAAGEAHEAIVAFEVAVAWGWLEAEDAADGVDKLRHVLAILWKVR